MNHSTKTVWPSGLRRWLKAPFRKGVGSNPTAVMWLHRACARPECVCARHGPHALLACAVGVWAGRTRRWCARGCWAWREPTPAGWAPHTVGGRRAWLPRCVAHPTRPAPQNTWFLVGPTCLNHSTKTVWPSGLRRWLKAPFRKGVGSNPTAVTPGNGLRWDSLYVRCVQVCQACAMCCHGPHLPRCVVTHGSQALRLPMRAASKLCLAASM